MISYLRTRVIIEALIALAGSQVASEAVEVHSAPSCGIESAPYARSVTRKHRAFSPRDAYKKQHVPGKAKIMQRTAQRKMRRIRDVPRYF